MAGNAPDVIEVVVENLPERIGRSRRLRPQRIENVGGLQPDAAVGVGQEIAEHAGSASAELPRLASAKAAWARTSGASSRRALRSVLAAGLPRAPI